MHAGHADVNGLDIIRADITTREDRPSEYRVGATQGAFTLLYMQSDDAVPISARGDRRFGRTPLVSSDWAVESSSATSTSRAAGW